MTTEQELPVQVRGLIEASMMLEKLYDAEERAEVREDLRACITIIDRRVGMDIKAVEILRAAVRPRGPE